MSDPPTGWQTGEGRYRGPLPSCAWVPLRAVDREARRRPHLRVRRVVRVAERLEHRHLHLICAFRHLVRDLADLAGDGALERPVPAVGEEAGPRAVPREVVLD